MSFFPGAQHFVVNGGNFGPVQVHNVNGSSPSGIEILFEASNHDAAVDAESRKYAARCYPDTREQYIHDIVHWATAPADETTLPMYWMRGPAGVGKSAIAQTCAERVQEAGQLGAAFFFSVSGRSDHRRFVPTLAYQLTTIFPDYRRIVAERIYNDRSIVRKTMKSQFNALIIEPLRELEKQGKRVGRRAIFIDGLDECQGNDAQSEIIDLIATSVRAKTTPFHWAIFSRPEPHIKATFNEEHISPLCYCVLLPVSREADGEIERYLWGGFKNMLRRRNLLSMSASWPAKEDIQKLVDASAGLFAYPAAVLRFVDRHSFLGFEHALQVVLSTISDARSDQNQSPFAELDTLYMLILERIPEDTLPSARLFLVHLAQQRLHAGPWSAALVCNLLGFSEAVFRGLCHQLHAVVDHQDCPESPEPSTNEPDFISSPSFVHQRIRKRCPWFGNKLYHVFGLIGFHHKSFIDFLADPSRSLGFCVLTPSALEHHFNHLVKRHHDFSQCLMPDVSGLTLASNIPSSSNCVSWPYGSESIDSFFLIRCFTTVSSQLSHDSRHLATFLDSVPLHFLQNLSMLDYRKFLISDIMCPGIGLRYDTLVLDYYGINRVLPGMVSSCLRSKSFDPGVFLALVKKLENLGIIEPYDHPSSPANTTFEQQAKARGQYKLGHGDKAVYWYWEFDTGLEYFHEFRAVDFMEAMELYQAEKFRMWDETWQPPLPVTRA